MNMKRIIACIVVSAFITTSFCQQTIKQELAKKKIYDTEKAFERMASEKGIAEAFYFYADKNAVILRGNDSIIRGNVQIKEFYEKKQNKNTTVNWSPDFIEVSKDGTLAYTYGKYVWKIRKEDGTTSESKGVFHTVWKLQQDKTWKFVWD